MSPELRAAIAIAGPVLAGLGGPADRAVKAALREHPRISNETRRWVARLVFGVRCFELRLDFLLGALGLAPAAEPRVAAYLADVAGEPAALAALGRGMADLERARAAIDALADPVSRLSIRRAMPHWIAARVAAERGLADADRLFSALNVPGPITVRANRRLGDREALRARLAAEGIAADPTPLAPDGLHLHGRPDLRGSAAFRAGAFEVQDEGSQLIARAVGARPGEVVVDLCAGAGGKTLALAVEMDDRGRLVAADVDPARLQDLRGRAGRLGLRSVEPVRLPAELPPADRVLVDAPCSALGTLRRGPDRRHLVTPDEVVGHAERGVALAVAGARLLEPGGRLVYATCTILEAENEAVLRAVLAADPGLERAALFDDGPFAGRSELTLLPHLHGTDGFYLAAVARR